MTGAASAATFDYSVFGLQLRSELALPELLEADVSSQPQVTVGIGTTPKPPAPGVGPHPVGGGLLLAIPAVARYFVKGGSSITVEPEPGVPEANVRLFLLGSAMGALLHQRGLLPLHANAVEIGGRAFAFMGASGSGKSTLAAWFHDHGYRIIADDVCAIRFDAEHLVVAPGLPRLRLWKEALEGLGRHHSHYSRSYAGDESWDKFDVPLPQGRAVRAEMELSGIYLLDKGNSLSISPLQGLEATEAVFANTYRGTYSSQGAAIRVAMNLVPAAAFFLFQRRFGFSVVERRIWFFHSAAAFALLILLLFLPSSTAVDRLALYVMPLQIAVLSRFPMIFGPRLGTVIVVLYSLAIEFVWLNFASHASFWVPYKLYPLF